jgi:transcriptional regulator with XRE-family HTH domain
MQMNELTTPDIIRRKLRSARLSAKRSLKACAALLNISLDLYSAYETGAMVPSLPEIELLCQFLNVNLMELLGTDEITLALHPNIDEQVNNSKLILLRQKIIGAKIRYLREEMDLTPTQFALKAAFPEDALEGYEFGMTPIRLTILYRILKVLGVQYSDLIESQIKNLTTEPMKEQFPSKSSPQSSDNDQGFSKIELI